ncbi:5676_t:CDS:2 [Scutellospora calospora]|uniref:5676_t:CDS:1 n=1 Tax=Scutellospora calospora TaxID=85575 RepID=A0ACA9K225_9GLOM|nr:5676_t:CDS:2 [Scutellospora calospora]
MHHATWTWDDLKTVNKNLYNTYQEAAYEMRLFTKENEDIFNIEEAISNYYTPAQLCFLFIQLILHDGKAGCDKTFLINAICYAIRAAEEIVLICRTTALSALLYEGGHAAHSLFCIPVEENNINIQSTIKYMSNQADLIREAKLICRYSSLTNLQKQQTIWRKTSNRYVFNQPIRNANNPIFAKFIDNFSENYKNHEISLNIFKTIQNIEEATLFLYPENILSDNNILQKRAFLSLRNSLVDDFNYKILNKLPGTIHIYFSHDIVKENDKIITDHPTTTPDYLAQLTYLGIPNHEIH